MHRRAFMKSGALALFATGFANGIPGFLARAAAQQQFVPLYGKKKTLVCIFQRGAMDGLMAVSPFQDPFLAAARPNLFMSPASNKGGQIELNERFSMHTALSALHPYFQSKQLAIAHGVGSPNTTRSHFDAQDYMESGTPFSKSTETGWLNRAIGLLGHEGTPFRSVSLTAALPRSMYGPNGALAISNLEDFAIQSRNRPQLNQQASSSFESLYDQTAHQLLQKAGKESFEAMQMLKPAQIRNYKPKEGVQYPNSPLGNALKQIAMLIKLDVGLELAFAESGGWDTHINQGTVQGSFARNLKDLGDSIAAFWQDMGGLESNVQVMTMTEFGRTVKQNGTGGTDHGRASCMFMLGGALKGGQVFERMGSLAPELLEDNRDVPVTTDFREVFAAVAKGHLGIQESAKLFPGWDGKLLQGLY